MTEALRFLFTSGVNKKGLRFKFALYYYYVIVRLKFFCKAAGKEVMQCKNVLQESFVHGCILYVVPGYGNVVQ